MSWKDKYDRSLCKFLFGTHPDFQMKSAFNLSETSIANSPDSRDLIQQNYALDTPGQFEAARKGLLQKVLPGLDRNISASIYVILTRESP